MTETVRQLLDTYDAPDGDQAAVDSAPVFGHGWRGLAKV